MRQSESNPNFRTAFVREIGRNLLNISGLRIYLFYLLEKFLHTPFVTRFEAKNLEILAKFHRELSDSITHDQGMNIYRIQWAGSAPLSCKG